MFQEIEDDEVGCTPFDDGNRVILRGKVSDCDEPQEGGAGEGDEIPFWCGAELEQILEKAMEPFFSGEDGDDDTCGYRGAEFCLIVEEGVEGVGNRFELAESDVSGGPTEGTCEQEEGCHGFVLNDVFQGLFSVVGSSCFLVNGRLKTEFGFP